MSIMSRLVLTAQMAQAAKRSGADTWRLMAVTVVEHIRESRASARKLRLLGAACARQWARSQSPEPSSISSSLDTLLQLAETVDDTDRFQHRVFDGGAKLQDLADDCRERLDREIASWILLGFSWEPHRGSTIATRCVRESIMSYMMHSDTWQQQLLLPGTDMEPPVYTVARLLDEILLPWKSAVLGFKKTRARRYLTPDLKVLALDIYNDRDWSLLGLLADGLEDNGYPQGDDQLLAHLRQPDGHVRGCWSLDVLLGLDD